MKYRDKIIEYFEALPVGTVVSASDLYQKEFTKMSDTAYYKTIERLAVDGVLIRISKGMYTIKKSDTKQYRTPWGVNDSFKEQTALNYYFGNDNANGMYIGSKLYFKYGLSNVTDGEIELYSNILKKQTSHIGRLYVRRVDVDLTYDNTRVIEMLEILQNYNNIQDINKNKFASYARQFARNYNDDVTVYIINRMKYKKNTIAFLKKILDAYKVENGLNQFLSAASKYKTPSFIKLTKWKV